MTEQSTDDARACLARLVAQHGAAIRSDPEQLEALLRECCPRHGVQTFALISLARQGIVDELARPPDGAVRKRLRELATRTVEELGLSPQVSRWAVDAWAEALGMTARTGARRAAHPAVTSGEDRVASDPAAPAEHAGVVMRVGAAVGALAAVILVVGVVALRGAGASTITPALTGGVPRPPASTSPAPPPTSANTDEDAIALVLSTYYRAIDNKDYRVAWMQFSPQQQQRIGGIQVYTAGVATSFVTSAVLLRVTRQSPGVDLATVTFISNQSPASSPDGRGCDRWSLVYTMVQVDGAWRIDRAAGANGVPYGPC